MLLREQLSHLHALIAPSSIEIQWVVVDLWLPHDCLLIACDVTCPDCLFRRRCAHFRCTFR